jgi:phosphate transport system substrate-binding protein
MLSVRAKAAAAGVAAAGLISTFLSMPAHQAQAQSQQTIKVDGSSTVFPVTEAVAEEFQKAKRVQSG